MNKSNTNIDCSVAKEHLIGLMEKGSVSHGELEQLKDAYPTCAREIQDTYTYWIAIGELETEEPTARMDALFYKSLNEFQAEPSEKVQEDAKVVSFFTRYRTNIIRLGVAASIFLAGMLIGPQFMSDTSKTKTIINGQNVQPVSYTESKMSFQRLEDISQIKESNQLSDKIIEALNQALLMDPNVNVRLSAIEAMVHFADNPKVRQNLIKAIPYQDAPIVQLTLAEVMIELEEAQGSKEQWQELFKNQTLESDVKKQLEETLKVII